MPVQTGIRLKNELREFLFTESTLNRYSFSLIGKIINGLNYRWSTKYAYDQIKQKWGKPLIFATTYINPDRLACT